MTQTINTPVNVNAFYFAGPNLKTFPRQIEYRNHAVTFRSGLRYLVHRGAQAIRLFDMSGEDGLTYRLQQQGQDWTLLATKGAFTGEPLSVGVSFSAGSTLPAGGSY